MPAQEKNELTVWKNGAPIVNLNPNEEFTIWRDGAPVADIDETQGGQVPPVGGGRRRAFIF